MTIYGTLSNKECHFRTKCPDGSYFRLGSLAGGVMKIKG